MLSTPLVLPASVAGALAALFVVLMVMALRRAGAGSLQRLLLPVAAIVVVALAAIALIDRMAQDNRAAERRALLQRSTVLAASVLVPGSALACLDGGAGEPIENACEKAVFADAPSAASAVAYTGARLALLKDASAFAQHGEAGFLDAFAGTRRALELDRFGLAAHVLATRDGCTVEACAAFALLRDTAALKANLRVHAFDGYVARYAADWGKLDAKAEVKSEPVAEKQPAAPAASPVAGAQAPQAAPHQPVASRSDFPSAASIPPVSIMNAEPPLPKEPKTATEAAASAPNPPVPPKRPQTQAATPPAR
ncbi:MAG: hypothetical protein HY244_00010 [Rhizobiales bacterium]|nr:hypothetical protein [Hyphomicrobiales bacterium]